MDVVMKPIDQSQMQVAGTSIILPWILFLFY